MSSYGFPIFEHEKALSSKRVYINNSFNNLFGQYISEKGKDFFSSQGWKEDLFSFADDLSKNNEIIEKVESQAEYEERIKFELSYTKDIMEKKLDKKVNFLCWPGGSGTKEGIKIAKDLGYLMSTAARDLTTQERKNIKNSPEYKIDRVSRITPIMINRWKKDDVNSKITYSPGWYFILQLWHFRRINLTQFWFGFFIRLNHKIR